MKVFVIRRESDPHPHLEEARALADVEIGGEEELARSLEEVDIILTWMGGNPRRVLAESLARAGCLRWIHHSGIGVDHLLFPELVRSPIILTNGSGRRIYAQAMAEFALAGILTYAKRLPEVAANQRRRVWRRFRTVLLEDQTVGIIGLGGVGRALADKAGTLGMRVMALRASPQEAPPSVSRLLGAEGLPELLRTADYVVVACPLTPRTLGLIGEAELRMMKPTAVLINVARGAIVPEAGLIRALREGWIGGAVLDVFEQEPLPSTSPLWDLPTVLISPHMSALVPGFAEETAAFFVENLRRYLAGAPLEGVVDKERGY